MHLKAYIEPLHRFISSWAYIHTWHEAPRRRHPPGCKVYLYRCKHSPQTCSLVIISLRQTSPNLIRLVYLITKYNFTEHNNNVLLSLQIPR